MENDWLREIYLFATLPATTDKKVPVLGFMAHVDTAPGCSGENVKPQVIENYSGGDIPLKGSGAVLSPKEFPALDSLHGHTLVTTDGTTLLGADDKSGIAIILLAVEYPLQGMGDDDQEDSGEDITLRQKQGKDYLLLGVRG